MGMILAVAGGGALGSVLRYLIGHVTMGIAKSDFPWGTLSVNVIGSFLMGVVVTYMALTWNPSAEVRAFLTVGLLGGFTTFSAFSLDAMALWEQGNAVQALGYTVGSVLLSFLGLAIGVMIVKAILS